MYWRGSGHRPIGGKMLKFLFLLFLSFPALACLGVNVEGKLAVDGQTWKMSQKFDLGKEYSVPMGPYILSMTVTHEGKTFLSKYKVEEKKGTKLVLVTKGEEEEIELGKSRDIMAKGEEGQPNSIITINLKDI